MAAYAKNVKSINRQTVMDGIVTELHAKLIEQQSKKTQVEERWLADLQQYYGEYPPELRSKLDAQQQQTGSSTIFVNQTRPKCNMAESRLADMLFPVDGRNWALDLPAELRADSSPDPQLQMYIDDAEQRAKNMQAEMDSQLKESDYSIIGRDCIHDAVLLGTGIVRGPMAKAKRERRWEQVADGVYEIVVDESEQPGFARVNPWDFFPDMAANGARDSEFFFERDYLTRLQVQDLLKHPGYKATRQQIKDVLTLGPGVTYVGRGEDRRQQIRVLSGVTTESVRTKFERWRYHGPVRKSLLQDIGMEIDGDDMEIPIYIEFIGDKMIKFDKLLLDTEEYPYNMFCWFQAEETPFGFGIPWAMRSSQSAMNSTWRAMLDNAALSAGPQIVMDENAIEPTDGQWALSPRKVWRKLTGAVSKTVRDVFTVFDIRSWQPELMGIYSEAKVLADEETSLPLIAQGQAPNVQQTATTTSMQMNSANAVLRRVVKAWDDDITQPVMTRLYDWNMQYNERDDIKVDAVVKPRGTSTLLVKETQSAAILQMMNITQSPALAPWSKFDAMLRTAWETLHINPEDYVKTQAEYESDQAQLAQQPQEPDPDKVADLQAKMAMNEQDNEATLAKAEMDNQTKVLLQIMDMAARGEIAADQMEAKYAEMMLKLQTGSGI